MTCYSCDLLKYREGRGWGLKREGDLIILFHYKGEAFLLERGVVRGEAY